MPQCQGITRKGERCKISSSGLFCHHHAPSAPGTFPEHTLNPLHHSSSYVHHAGIPTCKETRIVESHGSASRARIYTTSKAKQQSRMQAGNASGRHHATAPHLGIFEVVPPTAVPARPGHIYVYTFLHLLESDKRSDLGIYVTNHPFAQKSERNVPISYVPSKMPFIMVKIGMTTQRVNTRIQQWRDQCKCDITQLGPSNDKFRNLKDKSAKGWLERRFSSLSIGEYDTYDKGQNAFHCAQNVARAERAIHDALAERFGRVNFNCLGCSYDGNYKVHVEWFCVPKSELRHVYRMIDKCCKQ